MEMTKEVLAKRIRELRKKRGLTQADLADLANISGRTIQQIEYGASWPSALYLVRIASALGVDVSGLIGEPEPTPQTPVEEQLAALTQQIEALRSQIETMQPKPSDGKGRESKGVYSYTPETIVSKSQPATPRGPQSQNQNARETALLKAFQSADEETRQTIEIGLGLREYHPETETDSQEPAKHKNKA